MSAPRRRQNRNFRREIVVIKRVAQDIDDWSRWRVAQRRGKLITTFRTSDFSFHMHVRAFARRANWGWTIEVRHKRAAKSSRDNVRCQVWLHFKINPSDERREFKDTARVSRVATSEEIRANPRLFHGNLNNPQKLSNPRVNQHSRFPHPLRQKVSLSMTTLPVSTRTYEMSYFLAFLGHFLPWEQ